MSKPGPIPVFSLEETQKYERYIQTKDINEKRTQYMAFTPIERERCKLWIEAVAKPRNELYKRQMEEHHKRQEEYKEQMTAVDLRIKNLEAGKKDVFVQFGSKITSDIDKIQVQTPPGRPQQKSVKH